MKEKKFPISQSEGSNMEEDHDPTSRGYSS